MIRAVEPVLTITFDAVVLAFRNHQVRVRIMLVAVLVAAGVNRERIWQLVLTRQLLPPAGGTAKRRVRVLDSHVGGGQRQLGPAGGVLLLLGNERCDRVRKVRDVVAFLHARVRFAIARLR